MTEQRAVYIDHSMTDPATLPPDARIAGELNHAQSCLTACLGSVAVALEQAKKAGDLRRGDALISVQSELRQALKRLQGIR